jgi:hypothetical protein
MFRIKVIWRALPDKELGFTQVNLTLSFRDVVVSALHWFHYAFLPLIYTETELGI